MSTKLRKATQAFQAAVGRTSANKAVVALKDLPDSVLKVLKALPTKLPRDVHVKVESQAFRHYPTYERLFELGSGRIIDAPTEMPAGYRGDEDYFVAPNKIPLKAGQGYISNTGRGYASLQVTSADFAKLTSSVGEVPEVSKQEWWALDAIISTIPRGRPGTFKVHKLGPYGPKNPYILSLRRKGLLKGMRPTPLGQTTREQKGVYNLVDRPLRQASASDPDFDTVYEMAVDTYEAYHVPGGMWSNKRPKEISRRLKGMIERETGTKIPARMWRTVVEDLQATLDEAGGDYRIASNSQCT